MNKDKIIPHGHLEIWKVYRDGRPDELHFSDQNTITSGLGVGLAILFADQGSKVITDYQLRWFKLGVSGPATYGVSTFQLTSALSEDQYNTSGDLILDTHSNLRNGITVTDIDFARIEFHHIQKASPTSVRFILYIGKDNCNDLSVPLNEIGLFMHNPRGLSPLESILVAYKTFSSILKSNEFALVFRWTINF